MPRWLIKISVVPFFARFDAGDEFIALAGGIHAAEAYSFNNLPAQAVLRDFWRVSGPVVFHLADGRLFRADVETVFLPRILSTTAKFLGRGFAVKTRQASAGFLRRSMCTPSPRLQQHGLISGLLHGGRCG